MMAAATVKRVGGTTMHPPRMPMARGISPPESFPLSAGVTDFSIARSIVPSMGFTMKGIAARPAAVGIALAHSASTCATARPSAVALTTQRMKEPGQNTDASICHVKVSRETMAPRFSFWSSSVFGWLGGGSGEAGVRV